MVKLALEQIHQGGGHWTLDLQWCCSAWSRSLPLSSTDTHHHDITKWCQPQTRMSAHARASMLGRFLFSSKSGVPNRLDVKVLKMAVSLSPPPYPRAWLQRLTTTLRSKTLKSIPSCSKASGVFSSRCRYPASSRESHFHRVCLWDSSPVVTPFVRFGTYPKRNCAQTCYNFFVGQNISVWLCISLCSSDYILSPCGDPNV